MEQQNSNFDQFNGKQRRFQMPHTLSTIENKVKFFTNNAALANITKNAPLIRGKQFILEANHGKVTNFVTKPYDDWCAVCTITSQNWSIRIDKIWADHHQRHTLWFVLSATNQLTNRCFINKFTI
jgi:hypothetical protein